MALSFSLHWNGPDGEIEINMKTGTILSLTITPTDNDDEAGTIKSLYWHGLKIGGGKDNLWHGEFNDATIGEVQLSFTVTTTKANVGIYTSLGNVHVGKNESQTFTWRRSPNGLSELRAEQVGQRL